MSQLIRSLWSDEQGQDIAEYAVMLAVILVLVVGTVRLIGSNSNNAFSSVASSLPVRCSKSNKFVAAYIARRDPMTRFAPRFAFAVYYRFTWRAAAAQLGGKMSL